MDLRQLGYFLSIVEHRGFAAAARVRYISQSALTRQMQLLEEETGTKLLERTSRGVVLTRAGEILGERARQLLQDVHQLKEDLQAESEVPSGHLVLGMTPSTRVLIGGAVLEGFLRRYPKVRLSVIENLSHVIADSLARGVCDVGIFLRNDAEGKALSTRLLVNEPLVVGGPSRAGLRMDQPVDLEFVAKHPLLISRSNRVTSGLSKEASRLGLPLNVLMDVQPLHLSIDLVCRGVAYMVVPFSAALREYEAGSVSLAPIKGFETAWVVAWPSNRKVSVASAKMVDAVQTEFAALKVEETLRAALRSGPGDVPAAGKVRAAKKKGPRA
ncbi:LysR family transcriptional regulator [Variovorax sp. KK3]|uniref:LysR family transcriptional regulator n=1 Tax=Variovorax sp. KK3 TaxID=1855728 RepID=UPI00097BD9B8|nr:LysR family transcriptional regulator [Variovorax sp. KK3]